MEEHHAQLLASFTFTPTAKHIQYIFIYVCKDLDQRENNKLKKAGGHACIYVARGEAVNEKGSYTVTSSHESGSRTQGRISYGGKLCVCIYY
jgi:hypothetical protein